MLSITLTHKASTAFLSQAYWVSHAAMISAPFLPSPFSNQHRNYVEMRTVTRNSVGVLNDHLFEAYVTNRTRDYDMLLLFSYTQDRTACPSCVFGLLSDNEAKQVKRRLHQDLPSLERHESVLS